MKLLFYFFILNNYFLIKISISNSLMGMLTGQIDYIISNLYNSKDVKKLRIEEGKKERTKIFDTKEFKFKMVLKKFETGDLNKNNISSKYDRINQILNLKLTKFSIKTDINTNLLANSNFDISDEINLNLKIDFKKEGKEFKTKILDDIDFKFKNLKADSKDVKFLVTF